MSMSPALYAILGHTPMQSASPQMQSAGFDALGIDARYLRVAEAEPQRALALCRQLGLRGANVTAPFKEVLLRHVAADARARAIGAVNTLRFEGNAVCGFNTDPEGVIGALGELGAGDLRGQRAVVIGTGGAARSAILALVEAGAVAAVLGRDPQKAQALAHHFGAASSAPLSGPRAQALIQGADVIVGAASTRDRLIPPEWILRRAVVLDAIYGAPSRLAIDARARGCRTGDGLGWLLHQGAAAFRIWTGLPAPIAKMRAALALPSALARQLPARGLSLIGCSGAGKSALAPLVAADIGLAAVDLDREIELQAGMAVPEIFAAHGEAGFRAREARALARVCRQRAVLALGAGALIAADNRAAARQERLVAWLAIDGDTARARIAPGSRPLLAMAAAAGAQAWTAQFEAHLRARLGGYARTCDVVLDARRPLGELRRALAELWLSLSPASSGERR